MGSTRLQPTTASSYNPDAHLAPLRRYPTSRHLTRTCIRSDVSSSAVRMTALPPRRPAHCTRPAPLRRRLAVPRVLILVISCGRHWRGLWLVHADDQPVILGSPLRRNHDRSSLSSLNAIALRTLVHSHDYNHHFASIIRSISISIGISSWISNHRPQRQ